MNLRTAKKVARTPSRYTQQQLIDAAHRLYRRATRFKDGTAAYRALMLKPLASFVPDDQLDLRLETFLIQDESDLPLTFAPGEVVVPPSNGSPYFRRDGQVHNFNALPFPGFEKAPKYSAKKYRLRNPGGQGLMPPGASSAPYGRR